MLFHCPQSCGFCEQQANWFASAFGRFGMSLPDELQQRVNDIGSRGTTTGADGVNEAVIDPAGSYESTTTTSQVTRGISQDECVDKEPDCERRRELGQCEEYPV